MDLQSLSDRAEIGDLLATYCRGVDRADEATLASVYHEDATEDRGPERYVGPAHEWVPIALERVRRFDVTQHMIANILIELEGDVAHGETYYHAYHLISGDRDDLEADFDWAAGGGEMVLAGRYLDRFERRDGSWKIAYRRMVCDWARTQPISDSWLAGASGLHRATRGLENSRL